MWVLGASVSRVTEFRPSMGRWWLPGEPENQVAGYLELVPDDQTFPWRLNLERPLRDWDAPRDRDDRYAMTLYGETSFGLCTLRRAVPGGTHSHSSPSGRLSMEHWGAMQLIRGGQHHQADAKYHWATFRLPHLWHWVGPTGLNGYSRRPRPKPDVDKIEEAGCAQLEDGLRLDLARMYVSSMSQTEDGKKGHAFYRLASDGGLTLGEIESIAHALALLHSLVTSERMEVFALRFGVRGDDPWRGFEEIDAGPPAGHDWPLSGLPDPYFDTSEVEFDGFMKEWLRIFRNSPGIAAVAAPRRDRPFVTTVLVDACNAVEALAALLWDEDRPGLQAEDRRVLEALEGKVKGRTHKDIERYLTQRRWSLSSKLVRLAEFIGPESSRWLVGSRLEDWAEVTARLRNSLAHGSRMNGGMSDDWDFHIAASQALTAITRLGLLRATGYTNPLAKAPRGELLYSRGRPIVSHNNSPFFHQLEGVAERAPDWAAWRQRIDATEQQD